MIKFVDKCSDKAEVKMSDITPGQPFRCDLDGTNGVFVLMRSSESEFVVICFTQHNSCEIFENRWSTRVLQRWSTLPESVLERKKVYNFSYVDLEMKVV